MEILCVTATQFEVESFLQARPQADFLVTGIGVPMTIYALAKRLCQKKYDLVVQAGIAGTFDASMPLASVVIVENDRFADLGMSEKNVFSTVFEAGFGNENEFPFDKGALPNKSTFLQQISFPKVTAITVNTFTDNLDQIKQMKHKFEAIAESMEGAGFHYTCLKEQVPFLQLRSFSNYVGERDRQKWKMREAIENLNNALINMYDKFTSSTFDANGTLVIT